MANRDFALHGCYGFPNICHSKHQYDFGSQYGSNISGPPRFTDSTQCVSSSTYDGSRGIAGENKRVMYHEDGLSCDRYRRFHDCSCQQYRSQSTGYEKHSCGLKKEEYAAAKYNTGEFQSGRFW